MNFRRELDSRNFVDCWNPTAEGAPLQGGCPIKTKRQSVSSPLDRELGPDEPSPYAPKWVRDAAEREIKTLRRSENLEQKNLSEFARPDESFVIDEYRLPRSLEPTLMPETWPVRRSASTFGAVSLLAGAVAVAALVAFFVVIKFSADRDVVASSELPPSFGSRFSGSNSDARKQTTGGFKQPRPAKLTITQGGPRAAGEAVPLDALVTGAVPGGTIVISGLAGGSTLNVGHALGANGWRLSAADLSEALVQPPPRFAGLMELVLELRLADDSTADRKSMHLEWVGPPPARGPRFAMRQLDREEISVLLRRGEDFIANGDLASARLVLQRAAEAGDPRAALRLAGTYDPIVLEQQSAPGFAVNPNIAMARTWYERAKDLGSTDALRRLESLASRNR